MGGWLGLLNDDPLPWLLEPGEPGPRHLALRQLLDRSPDEPELVEARTAAMASAPIAPILEAQDPQGWWVRPGHGYGPKYSGTVWSLMFLDQLGADGSDPRIRAGCEYVLRYSQTAAGGFSATGPVDGHAVPSGTIHCLNGNLLRAMIGFGLLDDARVQRSIAWQAAAITGNEMEHWYSLTPRPGFCCGANDGRPCAWGAIKALIALARVPSGKRSPAVARAIDVAIEFLLSRDPAVADYPMHPRAAAPSGSWFRLGFPSGYVADVLQNLEALCDAGAAADPRLDRAFAWLISQQDAQGRWANRYAYHGKMVLDIDRQGRPSKWVTLRACRVLKARSEAAGSKPD
jgi:hypothetical protein